MKIKLVVVGTILVALMLAVGLVGVSRLTRAAQPIHKAHVLTTHPFTSNHPDLSQPLLTRSGGWQLVCIPSSATTATCWIGITEGPGY